MWFAIAVFFLSMLSLLDLGIFTYIGYNFPVSSLYYGVIAAMWSLFYIVSNKVFGPLADRGSNKLLMLLSALFIIISTLLFSRGTLHFVSMAYMFHALSVSTSSLSLSATIFENVESETWWRYAAFQRLFVYLIRGTSLLIISSGILKITLLQVLAVASIASIVSLIAIPQISINLERKLHLLGKNTESLINSSARAVAYASYSNPYEGAKALAIGNYASKSITPARVLVSIFLATATGDFMFTIMPLMINTTISLNSLWFSHGITGIVVGISLFILSNSFKGERKTASLLIAARGLWLVLAIPLLYKPQTLVLYLILMYMLFGALDTVMYNLYSEITSGYGTNMYYISREVGTLVGSFIAGAVYTLGYISIVSIPLIMTLISILSLFI